MKTLVDTIVFTVALLIGWRVGGEGWPVWYLFVSVLACVAGSLLGEYMAKRSNGS